MPTTVPISCTNVERVEGSRASRRAARSTFSPSASLQSAEAVFKRASDDRSVDGMFQKLWTTPHVGRVVATKRESPRSRSAS